MLKQCKCLNFMYIFHKKRIFKVGFLWILTNKKNKLDKSKLLMYNKNRRWEFWELSSAGRASALQAEGHRFEPCSSHHLRPCSSVG